MLMIMIMMMMIMMMMMTMIMVMMIMLLMMMFLDIFCIKAMNILKKFHTYPGVLRVIDIKDMSDMESKKMGVT